MESAAGSEEEATISTAVSVTAGGFDTRAEITPYVLGSSGRGEVRHYTKGIAIAVNQVGFLPKGLTPTVEGRPKVSRRCATDPFPRSWRFNNIASDASRISPTVFKPAVVSAFRTLVENRTFSMGVSSGSSGAGYSIGPATASRAKRSARRRSRFAWNAC